MLNKTNTKQGERTMARRNRNVIKNTLNFYKEVNRELNYFGIICTVEYADKYKAKINIIKVDGTTEVRDVDALDLFDNSSSVRASMEKEKKELTDDAKEELAINGDIFNTEGRA
tara:strand:- start:304 stop:645 length:342 start_codon:yes stop_codon:yes gene_type:complete